MRTSAYFMIALFVANLFTNQIFAQGIVINGNVVNSTTNESIQAVSVTVKDGSSGTFTDDKGSFKLPVEKLPVTLIISSAEFTSKEVVVESSAEPLSLQLEPRNALGEVVVVSATRMATRILESPVSI